MRYISIPITGSRDHTFLGALENADRIREILPDFTTVLWLPETKQNWQPVLSRQAVVKLLPHVNTATAFHAAALPHAEIVLVRMPETRITFREQSAIRHWIGSGKDFHTMRDHPLATVDSPVTATSLGFRVSAINVDELLGSPEMASQGLYAVEKVYRKHFLPLFTPENRMEHDGVDPTPETEFPAHSETPGYVGQAIL